MTVFQTTITKIGPQAEDFKEEKMIILFGNGAPETLADYCYSIQEQSCQGTIEPNMQLVFNQEGYTITAVGSLVQTNLDTLGHITIKFDGAIGAELPGTLYVEEKPLPDIVVGTKVTIQ